jgi:hypothetical protein
MVDANLRAAQRDLKKSKRFILGSFAGSVARLKKLREILRHYFDACHCNGMLQVLMARISRNARI